MRGRGEESDSSKYVTSCYMTASPHQRKEKERERERERDRERGEKERQLFQYEKWWEEKCLIYVGEERCYGTPTLKLGK